MRGRSLILVLGFFTVAGGFVLAGMYYANRLPQLTTPTQNIVAQETRVLSEPESQPAQHLRAYLVRAAAYTRSGDFDGAIADYKSIIALLPANSPLLPSIRAALLNSYLQKHDYVDAMALWHQATDGHKLTAFDILYRGIIYTGTGDYDRAEQDLDRAEELLPTFVPVQMARYQLFLAEGNYNGALAALDRIQQLVPYYPGVHNLRGWLYLRELDVVDAWREFTTQGEMAKAQLDLEAIARRIPEEQTALKIDPVIADCTTILNARPQAWHYRLVRGEMYSWKGDLPDALADIKVVLHDQPISPDILEELGAVYFNAGKFDMAATEYRAARAFTERKGPLYREHGMAEFALGKYPDAANDFIAALAENPADAYSTIWLHLTRVRTHTDDKDELAKYAAALSPNAWPEPVIEYMQGKQDDTALTAAANNGSTPAVLRDQNCEADYYAGILALDRDDKAKGLDDLRSAARSCPPGFFEQTMAVLALKQAPAG